MIILDKTFSLTVPLYDNDGTPTPQAVYDRLNALTKLVGGCTVQQVQGEWIDSDGTVYVDENAIYTWNFSGNEERLEPRINLAILGLFSQMQQQAVMFKLGDVAYIQDRSAADNFDAMEHAIKNYLEGAKK